jgi:peptidoglycan-N-acetylglucosamine deacetylase
VRSERRATAAVSIDLDSEATHLTGYGFTQPRSQRLLPIAVDRLLELLASRSVRATFFVVGRDARERPAWLSTIRDAGHELGAHSMSHPVGLSRLSDGHLSAELQEGRQILEDVSGRAVDGMRAPSWDVSTRVLAAAARAGYAYDASLLPSPLLIPARLLVAAKGRSAASLLAMPWWPSSLRRGPRRHLTAWGPIMELPVTVTGAVGWPMYHTLRYRMSDERFGVALDRIADHGTLLSYPLHGIDALGIDEDGLDERLARHPGGRLGRSMKLDLLARTLDAIVARFEIATLGDVATRLTSGGDA